MISVDMICHFPCMFETQSYTTCEPDPGKTEDKGRLAHVSRPSLQSDFDPQLCLRSQFTSLAFLIHLETTNNQAVSHQKDLICLVFV